MGEAMRLVNRNPYAQDMIDGVPYAIRRDDPHPPPYYPSKPGRIRRVDIIYLRDKWIEIAEDVKAPKSRRATAALAANDLHWLLQGGHIVPDKKRAQ